MDPTARVPLVEHAPIHVEGVLTEASNLTLRVQLVVDGEPSTQRAVYKPIDGERALADFPTGTLAYREVAAYHISEAGGWGLVPRTVLREGPMGLGSVQEWKQVEPDADGRPASGLMDVVRAGEVPPGWLSVLQGEDTTGAPVCVIHRDDPRLASLATLDVVLNNADRKAAHIAVDDGGALWGFDHGLIGHVHPKLRTVLWGWAGEPVPDADLGRLQRLVDFLQRSDDLEALLSAEECTALGDRVSRLLSQGRFPDVPYGRYPLPWPLW
ncbi:MAG TPA: SCO1664 family protein [Ornithinimicrobium sp.]|uniref:SCO1664 family protein n=1 Tax=Ornithinimicrobium sp. TaxID=1977084 RepID=UPI002B4AA9F4|nr:SCO1664 family protein [Ornithinimicrobium sp.]HKJ12519.1 SCO1664 family protein [Ornithinimicrobium sp.]